MSEIQNSIVDSINKYLNDLRYLGITDNKTLKDLMLLVITQDVYDWAEWYGAPQSEQLFLQNFRKAILRNNEKLIESIDITNLFYKNASLPQSIFTWQRVYDSPIVKTFETT